MFLDYLNTSRKDSDLHSKTPMKLTGRGNYSYFTYFRALDNLDEEIESLGGSNEKNQEEKQKSKSPPIEAAKPRKKNLEQRQQSLGELDSKIKEELSKL